MTGIAVLAAALAAGLLVGEPGRLRRLALPVGRSRRRGRTPRSWSALGLTAATVLAGVAWGWSGLALTGSFGLVLQTALMLWLRSRAETGEQALRAEVGDAVDALAGLLRIGAVPSVALAQAARECAVLRLPAALVAAGGSPAAAIRAASEEARSPDLAAVAVAWEVSESTGAALAEAMDSVAESLAGEREVRRTVLAELAAARATTRILAGLPLLGLLLGFVFGGNPLRFLIATSAGQACLLSGVAFACAGAVWGERVATAAVRRDS